MNTQHATTDFSPSLSTSNEDADYQLWVRQTDAMSRTEAFSRCPQLETLVAEFCNYCAESDDVVTAIGAVVHLDSLQRLGYEYDHGMAFVLWLPNAFAPCVAQLARQTPQVCNDPTRIFWSATTMTVMSVTLADGRMGLVHIAPYLFNAVVEDEHRSGNELLPPHGFVPMILMAGNRLAVGGFFLGKLREDDILVSGMYADTYDNFFMRDGPEEEQDDAENALEEDLQTGPGRYYEDDDWLTLEPLILDWRSKP